MNQLSSHAKTLRMVQIAFFAAIVAVLQVLSTVIPMPYVRITLTLVPVVLGGVYFGKKAAAFLGAVFGAVVTVFTVTGFDAGAYIMFTARPFMTVFICFAKGILAGFVSAALFELLSKSEKIGRTAAIAVAAAAAPIVNTGFFCIFMFAFYPEILASWAGGTNIFLYTITGLVGVNFIVEFLCNVVICPLVGTKVKVK